VAGALRHLSVSIGITFAPCVSVRAAFLSGLLRAKGTAKIELITEFSCELVQFVIAGSATLSRSCISSSQVRIGYPKFNSKLQDCQQTNIAEERPDECRSPMSEESAAISSSRVTS
jgi:hypothetical protein